VEKEGKNGKEGIVGTSQSNDGGGLWTVTVMEMVLVAPTGVSGKNTVPAFMVTPGMSVIVVA
jgi:hypothetical protein